MANGPSVLSRIGRGVLAFGANTTSSNIDTIRANRDLSEQNVEIAQNTAALQEQEIEANQAEVLKQQQVQGLVAAVQKGGPDAQEAANRLFQVAPEMADKLFKNMGATTAEKRENASRRSAEILGTPAEQRETVIRQQAVELRAEGRDPSDTEKLLGMTPEEQDAELRLVQGAALSTKERAAADVTQQQLALQERGVDIQEKRLVTEVANAVGLKALKAEERETKKVQADLKTEEGLRKEVNTLLKDFFKVSDANARIKAAGREPSAAGDLALIFNYMKMLDPGSTVREGEFATAENSASVPSRIMNIYNRIRTGERLGDDQRADFLDRAESLFGAAVQEASKTAESFERIASSAGVNVGNVLATFQQRAAEGDGGDTVQEGQTATNAAGEKIVFRDGQWVPA